MAAWGIIIEMKGNILGLAIHFQFLVNSQRLDTDLT